MVKNRPDTDDMRRRVSTLGWEDALEEAWQPLQVSLPRESMGRSLVGCSSQWSQRIRQD